MKKLLATLLVGACACAVVPFAMVQASAGEKNSVFLEEKFDELTTARWDLSNASDSIKLFASDDSHISWTNKNYHVEQMVVTTEEKLVNLEYFQFDYMHYGAKWNAIYFLPTTDLPINQQTFNKFVDTDAYSCYQPNIPIEPNSIGSWATTNTVSNKGWKINQKEWYTIRIKVVDAMNAEIYCVPQGQDVESASVAATIALKTNAQYSFNDLYIAFGCGTDAGQQVHLDNFKAKYQREVNGSFEDVTFEENFNNEINNVVAISPVNGKYQVEKAASMLAVTSAKKGDSIFYKNAVAAETSIVEDLECLDVSTTVSFKQGKNDSLSFAFGVKEGGYTQGSVLVDMYADGIKLAQMVNGVKTDICGKVATNALVQEGSIVRVVANKNGNVKVYVNGEQVIEEKIEIADEANKNYYAGQFGYVMTEDTDNAGKVVVDDVIVNIKSYKVPVTKSVTHNFSNDYFGNEGKEDFIYATTGGSMYVAEGKLVWDGLSDYSFFGSAHEYDDFVMEYKICNVLVSDQNTDINATGLNRWLGIDIAKSVKGLGQYGSSATFMFNINPTASENGLGFYVADDSPVDREALPYQVTNHKKIPAELLQAIAYNNETKTKMDVKDGDALCVRWVAEKGTLRLYLKQAREMNYTLYATVVDVDTTGYVAICCTGYTFLEIDDFSMSNISSVYVCADNYVPETQIKIEETIIYDRGNVDVNGATEAGLNKDNAKGCGSSISLSYCIMPTVLMGAALICKKRKDREEK